MRSPKARAGSASTRSASRTEPTGRLIGRVGCSKKIHSTTSFRLRISLQRQNEVLKPFMKVFMPFFNGYYFEEKKRLYSMSKTFKCIVIWCNLSISILSEVQLSFPEREAKTPRTTRGKRKKTPPGIDHKSRKISQMERAMKRKKLKRRERQRNPI